MRIIEVKNQSEAMEQGIVIPFASLRVYNAGHRDMTLLDVMNSLFIYNDYVPHGYDYFVFVRDEGTVYIDMIDRLDEVW